MGGAIYDKETQVRYLNDRFSLLQKVIAAIDPKTIQAEDIDRLIDLVENLEFKLHQYKSIDKQMGDVQREGNEPN